MRNSLFKRGKYLRDRAVAGRWALSGRASPAPHQVVVIPVLGERKRLFRTIDSLLESPWQDLEKSAVVCVVNNSLPGLCPHEYVADNLETLRILEALSNGNIPAGSGPDQSLFKRIAASPLRILFVDASSSGLELPPEYAGVGLARKIGMDLSLGLFDEDRLDSGILISLDADTLVERGYLTDVMKFFERNSHIGAVTIAFEHRMPPEGEHFEAIVAYELYLRYVVMGLLWAGSPYAFHSIGSAMACRAGEYIRAGGMNRRRVTEDFYFLQTLAKISSIAALYETRVFPSSRISGRVPVIGTGAAMEASLAGDRDLKYLYDPTLFCILKSWLSILDNAFDMGPEAVLESAHSVHPGLCSYLQSAGFESVWRKLKNNSPEWRQFLLQLHRWFDGLKTIRLINHLSAFLPRIPANRAFDGLIRMIENETGPVWTETESFVTEESTDLPVQKGLLELARRIEAVLASRRPVKGVNALSRRLINPAFQSKDE